MTEPHQLCIYTRGYKTSGFRFIGPSLSLDFLLINIMGKWNAFSRVTKRDGSSLPFPGNVFTNQRIVGAVRQCLFQAIVAEKWSLFSSNIRSLVADLPDVLTVSELQEWLEFFVQHTGIGVKVGRALIVDPDQEWTQLAGRCELVGYCALSPGWPSPISSVFEKTDLELWESALATSWMMLGPSTAERYAYQMPVEEFYWRHDAELRWWESFVNGCFDDLTSLQKLLSLLLAKHYLSRDYLMVRVFTID